MLYHRIADINAFVGLPRGKFGAFTRRWEHKDVRLTGPSEALKMMLQDLMYQLKKP